MTEFKISKYPLYENMETALRREAHEYAQRAQVYLTTKELDKAIGCLNKAIRKIKRADMLKLGPLEEKVFGPLIAKVAKDIADSIMEGKL